MVATRTPIVAGNWKMNTTLPDAIALVDAMLDELPFVHNVEKVLCPPFISLAAIRDRVAGTNILVGAQNAFWELKGAFTGEVSVTMLRGLVDYVILGHSERRQLFHETDEDIHRKVLAAHDAGLRVILCVGEDLAINEHGGTQRHVEGQVRSALAGLDDLSRIVIAYEPIWAIGTGRAATPDGASGVIGHIRSVVASLYGQGQADALRIQYGGSVTPENFAGFMAQDEIDGGLVGGASLRADSFLTLVRQAAEA